MTRRPVICSRRTVLTASTRRCIRLNSGRILRTTTASAPASTGVITSSAPDSGTSCPSASATAPTHMTGTETSTVQAASTNCWTCWTSPVVRVMSDAVPKRANCLPDMPCTLVKTAALRSLPSLAATRTPRWIAAPAHATCASVTATMTPPRVRTSRVSPLSTPSSMRAALRAGRQRRASVCAPCSRTRVMTAVREEVRRVRSSRISTPADAIAAREPRPWRYAAGGRPARPVVRALRVRGRR